MTATPLSALKETFPYWIQATEESPQPSLTILPGALHKVLSWLKHEAGFGVLTDLFGLETERGRLHSVVLLRHNDREETLRVVVDVPPEVSVPSLAPAFPAATWLEREAWEMFGIKFTAEEERRRLLTHWQFEGHPLRKSYPKEKTSPLTALASPAWLGMPAPGEGRSLLDLTPAHPVTGGLLRLVLEVERDRIARAEAEIGYGHRGVEKECEEKTWGAALPYAERVNTLSPSVSAQTYAMAVEELAGIEVPERVQWLRMILAEMGRIMEHSVAIGGVLHHVGLDAGTHYLFQIREPCTQVLDRLTGQRVNGSYDRIGGFREEVYAGFADDLREWMEGVLPVLKDVERMVFTNRLLQERTQGVGILTREAATGFGLTGPNARAAGVQRDLRVDEPYLRYDAVSFERVTGTQGDVYERIVVRVFEIKESLKILAQSVNAFLGTHGQRICANVPSFTLPPLTEVYTKLPQMIRHFNLWTQGEKIPPAQRYKSVEGPNGELGFFLRSDGSGRPARFRVRAPGFFSAQAMVAALPGLRLEDLGMFLASLHIVSGELDR